MRQRVMIAMALLVEPDLLVADECTTALDATVEAQIVALLEGLRRGFDGSIVFISHHLGLVAQLCDDLCVMYAGTVVETGPVADVLARPRHPTRGRCWSASSTIMRTAAGSSRFPARCPIRSRRSTPACSRRVARLPTDACRASIPALRDAGPGRRAACLRFEEIA